MKRQFAIALLAAGIACADQFVLNPIGFNKVVCLTNSDTIVGVPFRMQGSMRNVLASAPVVDPGNSDLVEIPLLSLSLTPGDLDRHYLKFEGGTRDGRWYDITANSATSVTIDLNGDTLDGVVQGDPIVITEYWTLDTLFPPGQATTAWTEHPENPGEMIPNGHAIVRSESAFSAGRRTELITPNYSGKGINLSASGTYYIWNGGWRKQGEPVSTNFGSTILVPDYYFIIRHPLVVSHSTIIRVSGEVNISNHVIPLSTIVGGRQDNFIAIPRPVNVTLDELSLGGTQAFVSSTTAFLSGRRDELLVFNNETAARNKSASATYYYFNGAWRQQGSAPTIDVGSDEIPAAYGFLIRKHQTANSGTVFWSNFPSY